MPLVSPLTTPKFSLKKLYSQNFTLQHPSKMRSENKKGGVSYLEYC
jgi:hypothetical protein